MRKDGQQTATSSSEELPRRTTSTSSPCKKRRLPPEFPSLLDADLAHEVRKIVVFLLCNLFFRFGLLVELERTVVRSVLGARTSCSG